MEIVGEPSRYALQEHLHLITAPLQVIWGKKDQVKYDVPIIQCDYIEILLLKQSLNELRGRM